MPSVNSENGDIEWNYSEVTAEVTRMGFTYPTAEDFTEDEIQRAVTQLADYYLTSNVAEYNGDSFTAAQVKAWASFVDTLGKDVRIATTASGFKVTRETSTDERRSRALSNLSADRAESNRKHAARELTRRYREEGTDAAGYKYDNGLTQ